MAKPPRDRSKPLFGLLRRTASRSAATRSAADDAATWAAHHRALESVKRSEDAAQKLATQAAKGRGTVDAAADRSRAVSTRLSEALSTLARAREQLGRLELIGLNASLEGTRIGEAAGKALSLVGDETRQLAARGLEAARDAAAELAEVQAELERLGEAMVQARTTADGVTQNVANLVSASSTARRDLDELALKLRKTTGSDPEVAKALAAATEHARALVSSLGTLSGTVPRGLILAALRPVLDPLSRLLEGEDDEDEA